MEIESTTPSKSVSSEEKESDSVEETEVKKSPESKTESHAQTPESKDIGKHKNRYVARLNLNKIFKNCRKIKTKY